MHRRVVPDEAVPPGAQDTRKLDAGRFDIRWCAHQLKGDTAAALRRDAGKLVVFERRDRDQPGGANTEAQPAKSIATNDELDAPARIRMSNDRNTGRPVLEYVSED